MAGELRAFLRNLASGAARRPESVSTAAWGRTRSFSRYDLFDDTFVLEDGILDRLENKDSVVLVPKAALRRGGAAADGSRVFGNVMTVSSGNHAVTSLPLLDGRFWGLSDLGPEEQADALAHRLVCANVVGDSFELSQRGVSTADLVEMDEWLQALGYPMRRIVLSERVDETIEFYARRGQEWRIKPLAWTPEEMEQVLRSSVSRMHSPLRYYHNVRGVHFLSFENFRRWGGLLRTDPAGFWQGLRELCGTSPEQPVPNLLLPKYQKHHEIEFFGMAAGVAAQTLVPAALEFWEKAGSADPADPAAVAGAAERFAAMEDTFRRSLADPALADETTPKFLETVYRYLSGEIYRDEHDSLSRAFDDLRTALPGATYSMGNRYAHDGADARTLAMLDTLEKGISHGDRIEYVNVYEIRSVTERVRLGLGKTREIVYKTMWSPLPNRLVEKRLARRSTGYGSYTLARIEAFRALGISYGRHRLLARSDGAAGDVHYFTRARYPGTPFSQLPQSSFYDRDERTGSYNPESESADIVRAVILLMGGAAAENIVLKKCTKDMSTRFAEGKEIVEFGFDIRYGKEMPLKIRLCSVRGTLGWPDLAKTDENIARCFDFYLGKYADVAASYARRHPVLAAWDVADAFWEGFAARTRVLHWNYMGRREQFDSFAPRLFGDYRFAEKWSFALWALEKQRERLPELGELFRVKFQAAIDG